VIRRATPADVDEIAVLFRRSFGTLDFLPTLHTPDEDRAHLAGVVAEQDVWVAEEDGQVVGFLALKGGHGTFFYVDPRAHGRGHGTALFREAQRARPEGFDFWVFQANELARRFYEQRGCVPVEFTDGAGNEEKTPDVRYEWRPGRPEGSSALGERPPA
jgi:ribosomal protein S18 acetylase RimI-like enzyme